MFGHFHVVLKKISQIIKKVLVNFEGNVIKFLKSFPKVKRKLVH